MVRVFLSADARELGRPVLETREVRSLSELDDVVDELTGKFLSFHDVHVRLSWSQARYMLRQYGEQK
jgi:hypothetical protein